VNCFTVGRK